MMKLLIFSITILVSPGLAQQQYPYACDSPVYCLPGTMGKTWLPETHSTSILTLIPDQPSLLHIVQMAKLYPDSKTFVDKPMKYPEAQVLESFNQLMQVDKDQSHASFLFVSRFSRRSARILVPTLTETRSDSLWMTTFPKKAPNSNNGSLRIGIQIPDSWTISRCQVVREILNCIEIHVQDSNRIRIIKNLPEPSMPDGTFWAERSTKALPIRSKRVWSTLTGLSLFPEVVSEKCTTGTRTGPSLASCNQRCTILFMVSYESPVQESIVLMHKPLGMLENFIHLIRLLGFIPNGTRIYYNRRSQPPLFISMVEEYYKVCGQSIKNKTLCINFLLLHRPLITSPLSESTSPTWKTSFNTGWSIGPEGLPKETLPTTWPGTMSW